MSAPITGDLRARTGRSQTARSPHMAQMDTGQGQRLNQAVESAVLAARTGSGPTPAESRGQEGDGAVEQLGEIARERLREALKERVAEGGRDRLARAVRGPGRARVRRGV